MNEDDWSRWPSTPVDWLLRRRLPWIVATRDPARARSLFAGGSWSQQQQVAFVLEPARPQA